jgi:hypothetical protein
MKHMSRGPYRRQQPPHHAPTAAHNGDALFFTRRPNRSFRVRRAYPEEIALHAKLEAAGQTVPMSAFRKDEVLGTIVAQLMPGARIKQFIRLRRDADPDTFSEAECYAYFAAAKNGGPPPHECPSRVREAK